jgi:hypothetical protein
MKLGSLILEWWVSRVLVIWNRYIRNFYRKITMYRIISPVHFRIHMPAICNSKAGFLAGVVGLPGIYEHCRGLVWSW